MAVACGGPSESDIKSALNQQMGDLRSILIVAGSTSDSCPKTTEGLGQLSFTDRQACVVLNYDFEDVDIEKCIEKGAAYSCKITATLASKLYGDTVSTREGMFEETASGWIAK